MSAANSGQMRAARLRAAAAALKDADPERAARQRRLAERVEKGNVGERRVGALLDVLDGAGWVVLHDRYKSAQSPANLDHVLIGPPGVFVVDAKNWSGRQLRLDERGMTLDRRRRDDALRAARADAELVARYAAAVVPDAATVGVLAFVQDFGLAAPAAHHQVVVLPAEQLLRWVTSQPARLTRQQVHQLASTLDAALPPRSGAPRPSTVGVLTGATPARPARLRRPGRGAGSRPDRRPVPRRSRPVPAPGPDSLRPHRRLAVPRPLSPGLRRRLSAVAVLAFLLLGGATPVLHVGTALTARLVEQVTPHLPSAPPAAPPAEARR